MYNTFFTSDTHLSHANIIKYTNRPYADINEMDEALIANWNATVSPGDTVYHLGDIAWCAPEKVISILNRLQGNKHIIWGNHDRKLRNNAQLVSKFMSAQDFKEISVQGQYIVLCHYGLRVWNRSHHSAIMLYGHSHNSLPPYGKSVDVGVDSQWVTGKAEYRPFSFEEVMEFMNQQPEMHPDHHGNH